MWWLWWDRFGRLPAVPVVAGSLTLQMVITLTLPFPISAVPGLVVGSAFLAYCVARPTKGWGIFLAAALPQCGSMLLHDITGVGKWWLYAALIPLAALVASEEEREAREEQAQAHETGSAAARPCPSRATASPRR